MSKKRMVRGFIVIAGLLLILAVTAVLLFMPKKAAAFPDFSAMPSDTAGCNMIGNLPENLASGGFMAGQNGRIYFTNFTDGGKLYMCRENGEDMTKITDFAVCNINVMGSAVVFTGFDDYREYESKGSGQTSGKLYAIYGLNSARTPRFCAIDPDNNYFSPYLDRDGLYAVRLDESQSALSNKSNGMSMVVTREGEAIKKIFSYGDIIYAELFNDSAETSRIMRIDAKTLMPLDSINGGSLYRIGNSFIFHGEDSFVHEIVPPNGDIKPISGVPVSDFTVNAFGDITATPLTDSAGFLILTKEQRYGAVAEMLLPRLNPDSITMQNGWYSYKKLNLQHDDEAIYFNANGKYYIHSLQRPKWSENWLNVASNAMPLISLDDVIVEDLFTPAWVDFSGDSEPIDPSDAGDFGSERPVRPASDDRPNAANDTQNALDAAILLLCEDEDIADKYTGESVELLRSLYGNAFEAALTDTADTLAVRFAPLFEDGVTTQESRDILMVWLNNTSFSIGDARLSSNGQEATVALQIENPIDLTMLYIRVAAGEFADLPYAEFLTQPDKYGFTSDSPEDTQVYMRLSQGAWIAESPDKLIHSFIRSLD